MGTAEAQVAVVAKAAVGARVAKAESWVGTAVVVQTGKGAAQVAAVTEAVTAEIEGAEATPAETQGTEYPVVAE